MPRGCKPHVPDGNHPCDAPPGLRLKAQLRILQESGSTTYRVAVRMQNSNQLTTYS